jgi:toxin ParE1/3/4
VKVQWYDQALEGLEDLLDYVAQDNPSAAKRLHAKVIEKTDLLSDFPNLGRVPPEVGDPFRELYVKPLRLIYLPEEETVTIIAVFREESDLGSTR